MRVRLHGQGLHVSPRESDHLPSLRSEREGGASRIIESGSPLLSPSAVSPRFNIDCGINVAVLDEPAAGAIVNPHAEALANHGVASAAFLRGAAWIHGDELTAGTLCLTREDRRELCPPGIIDLFGEAAPSKALNVEFFDRDRIESLDKTERNFMVKIEPDAAHAVALLGEQGDGFAPTPRSALAPGHLSLSANEIALRCLVGPWVGDELPGAERGERRDADVHADALAGRLEQFDRHVVACECDVPMAVARERHGGRFDPPLHWTVQFDFDVADAGEPDALATGKERRPVAVSRILEGERRVASPALESREAWLFTSLDSSEECAISAVQSRDGILEEMSVDLGELGTQVSDLAKLGHLSVPGERDASESVCVSSLLQRGVVELAKQRERPTHRPVLRRRRTEPISVDADHPMAINQFVANTQHFTAIPTPFTASSTIWFWVSKYRRRVFAGPMLDRREPPSWPRRRTHHQGYVSARGASRAARDEVSPWVSQAESRVQRLRKRHPNTQGLELRRAKWDQRTAQLPIPQRSQ